MEYDYGRKAFIKGIKLELPDYRFHHKPFQQYGKDNFEFVGREEISRQFLNTLLNGSSSGAYLVAGYRGMGKTSFVNNVLKAYEKELRGRGIGTLRAINVSLGKSDVRHEDLLKQLILALQMAVVNVFHRLLLWLVRPAHIFPLSIFIYFVCLAAMIFRSRLPHLGIGMIKFLDDTLFKTAGTKEYSIVIGSYILIPAIVSFLVGYLFINMGSLVLNFSPTIRLHKKLAMLYARCSSEISEEENVQSIVKNFNIGFFSKSTTKYPPLSIKETELQLIDIIRRLDRTTDVYQNQLVRVFKRMIRLLNRLLALCRYYRENVYVFVFDEMDKIEPGLDGNNYMKDVREYRTDEDSKTYIDEYRDKKHMMVAILSSLKNLITESNARYIFITGREMYEASLADIADRQNSVGSIFHKIIYVDSFLKDTVGKDPSGLSNVIENYLKKILLPPGFVKTWQQKRSDRDADEEPFLKLYFSLLTDKNYILGPPLELEEIHKIIFSLQQFIIYLTYRSNGSPKKISRLIEDLIENDDAVAGTQTGDGFYTIVRLSWRGRGWWRHRVAATLNVNAEAASGRNERLMLHLSYNNQFRFGFITYLYRPFLLTYGRRIKNYSDYLLVSTTYLVDHILKFHPFAFSTRNLELMPEVLSTSRSPQLRYFIDELILFLSYSYIRDTEINLFEYKFYNKIANEILYLTNLFEAESAAFNFTLDESHSIKMHIRNKILELRKIHKDFKSEQYEYIHSISALNNLLGDVRFFDQEYNDAITAYSDAIQALRHIPDIQSAKIEIVLLMIQLQLKLGLTYEKIKSYENALAYYTDSMEYAMRTVAEHYNATVRPVPGPEAQDNMPLPVGARNVSIHEMLQVSVHAFVANLYLLEKMIQQGVSVNNVNDTYSAVYDILDKLNIKLLQVTFLSNLATLVFYKNLFLQNIVAYQEMKLFHVSSPVDGVPFMDTMTGVGNMSSLRDYRFPNLSLYLNLLALEHQILFYRSTNPNASRISENRINNWMSRQLAMAFEMVAIDKLARVSNKDFLKNMAVLLARIGDILLTNIVSSEYVLFHELLDSDILKWGAQYREGLITVNWLTVMTGAKLQPVVEQGFTGPVLMRFRLVLACYFVSGKYYSLAGKIASCSYQYRRIFRVIASVVKFDRRKADVNEQTLDFLEWYLLREILKNTSTNSNGTDRVQIGKFKYYFDVDDLYFSPAYAKSVYGNISNNPEVREVVLLFAEMRLKTINIVHATVADSLTSLFEEQHLVNPFNVISSQWIRLTELRLQVGINGKLKKQYFDPLFKTFWPAFNNGKDSLLTYWRTEVFKLYNSIPGERLDRIKKGNHMSLNLTANEIIARDFFVILSSQSLSRDALKLLQQFREAVINSIHCLNHMIDILQTYGTAYPGGFAFIGDAYRYFVDWMISYYLVKEMEDVYRHSWKEGPLITMEIESIVGKENQRKTEPYGLAQAAQLFYFRAIEMHHEGNAYKTLVQTLNYLDDDFNDSMNHFAAALERQRVNSGNVRRHIEKMEQLLRHSRLFSYDSFVNNASL